MTVWLAMQGERPDGSTPRRFAMSAVRTSVGRAAQCDIRIALPSVAPHHCDIVNDGGEVSLVNHDPQTGTRVNGREVDQCRLTHGDRVEIGPVRFMVETRSEATTEVKPQPDRSTRGRHHSTRQQP